jgi:hypothetical protein
MRKYLNTLVLPMLVLWSAATGNAGTITLDLDPPGGTLSAVPGGTVGWGFTLTNSTTSWISVTSSALTFETNPSLGVYVDFIGLQGGPTPFFAVAPSTSWTQPFDGVSEGAGAYTISTSATAFALDSGLLMVGFDIFDGDPMAGGAQTGSSTVSAPFAIGVSPAAQIPEPSTLTLALPLLLMAWMSRLRSGSREGVA